jgi:putative FmdB family regulatory protein
MPTYDYICLSCGEEHEIFHSMNENHSRQCTGCKEGVLQKQISRGSGLVFKGTGFYETDYKRKDTAGEAKSKSEGSCSHKSACGCGK